MAVDRLYRAEIQIPAAQVGSGGVSDYTITLTEDCFIANCSELLDADGSQAPQADGGDVIVTTDEAGDTRIAVDLIKFSLDNNPALSEIQLSLGTTSLSSASLNKVYIWWGHASNQSQPAAGAAYGQYAAYESGLKLLLPFEGDANDRTSNANHGTRQGTGGANNLPQYTAGQVGQSLDFDGTDDAVQFADSGSVDLGSSDFTLSFWVYNDQTSTRKFIYNQRTSGSDYVAIEWTSGNKIFLDVWKTTNKISIQSNAVSAGEWKKVDISVDRDSVANSEIYIDGVQQTFGLPTVSTDNCAVSAAVHLCRWSGGGGFYFDGRLDHVKKLDRAFVQADATTSYNNENAPGTFAVAQSLVEVGGAARRLVNGGLVNHGLINGGLAL